MAENESEEEPKKKSKLPLIAGFVLMLVLSAAGFFAVYSGMLFPAEQTEHAEKPDDLEKIAMVELPDVAFVPIKPLVVNLASDGNASKHLRFQAQLEVPSAYENEVNALLPRIVDILNGYLRAVDATTLENPAALVRLRAQILRRVQIIAGEGRVSDVLIMEFVIT